MIFISENFFFDDISSKSMGIELVSFDDSLFNQVGMTYIEKVDKQDSPSSSPFYTSTVNEDTEEFTLNLMLVDKNGTQIEWDEMKTREILDWLITDDFKPFISEDSVDSVYYLKVTKVVKQFTSSKTGYLEVTFKPYSNYTYNKVKIVGNVADAETGIITVTINNTSNVDEFYKPVIEITGTGDNVTITNDSTKEEPFIINNLDGKVVVDNLFRTVQTELGVNKISTCNRKWIKLKRGTNILKVLGGTVTLICEFPVIR